MRVFVRVSQKKSCKSKLRPWHCKTSDRQGLLADYHGYVLTLMLVSRIGSHSVWFHNDDSEGVSIYSQVLPELQQFDASRERRTLDQAGQVYGNIPELFKQHLSCATMIHKVTKQNIYSPQLQL